MTLTDTINMTPMMRQYWALKDTCPGYILFFRMGDFFEIFGDDAELVAPKLQLVLTSRERGDQQRIPFCGVPHHSAKGYWLKLLKMGFRVALADQVEHPDAAKGLVRREITRYLTPALIDELDGLDDDCPNYFMALYEEPKDRHWSMVVADVSTGEFRLGNFDFSTLTDLIKRYRPKEILARKFVHNELQQLMTEDGGVDALLLSALPEAPLRDRNLQTSILHSVFAASDLESQPCGSVLGGLALVAAVLTHLQSLKMAHEQFLNIKPLFDPQCMQWDETAKRDLEIFETVRKRQAEGSLYHEINRTLTPMGARLLRHSLGHPLLDAATIQARQSAVQQLSDTTLLQNVRNQLKAVGDVERLLTRIVSGSSHPGELAAVRVALERALGLKAILTGVPSDSLVDQIKIVLGEAEQAVALLTQQLQEQPGPLGTGRQVFRPGFDAILDEKVSLSDDGEARVREYESLLKSQSGINSLKIKSHKSFGLLIEITKTNLARVPTEFMRRQTMVNCERYVTVELRELEETLQQASELAIHREAELFAKLLVALNEQKDRIRRVATAMATIDLIQSFAYKANEATYVIPKLSEAGDLELIGCRHPVVESSVGRHQFAANDVILNRKKRCLLITGPNMAGKSTVMRQTAIAALLHQIGSGVPARSAVMPIFDRIFTRVGASDDLARGQSTFMVEMSEAAQILRHASSKSLVILDEVGRGTSTQDGIAIASAILEDIVERVRSFVLFATHYHELVPAAAKFSAVALMQTEVLERDLRIVFTHRLVPGACSSSFGIEVARLAGLPGRVIARAQQLVAAAPSPTPQSATMPKSDHKSTELGSEGEAEPKPRPNLSQVAQRLEGLAIHRLTPLQALNILNDLKAALHAPAAVELFPEHPH